MEYKKDVFKYNSDRWWKNWWKSQFSAQNDPDSFNFHPGTNFIADKLGINGIKGFLLLVLVLIFLVLGIKSGIDYFLYNQTYQLNSTGQSISYYGRGGQVADAWIHFPETRMLIITIMIICILGALIIWWLFYKDS